MERQGLLDDSSGTNGNHQEYSQLVASCKHLLKPNGSVLGSDIAQTILPLFPSVYSAIPSRPCPALASIDGRASISQDRVRDFIQRELGPSLHSLGFGRGHRIALVLPNGPELALAILAISNWSCCVPLNASGAKSELEADLRACGANLVIGPASLQQYHDDEMHGTSSRTANLNSKDRCFNVMPNNAMPDSGAFDHVQETARKLGVSFVGLVPSKREAGIFRLVSDLPPTSAVSLSVPGGSDAYGTFSSSTESKGHSLGGPITAANRFWPSNHDDEVLVLFTSGTTGNKKIVVHKLGEMLVATATIALSWDLTSADVNCNLMPLFHVGGIVRQVYSVILSGGCVICCPSFDPSIFWALLKNKAFNWYYAAPTMHQLILQTGKEEVTGTTLAQSMNPKLRMIANAAGGLLPSLAFELRDTFHANILPSYGMTECMPISSPPAMYQLEKPGTSGVAVGPEIAILNLATFQSLKPGVEGPICVRGTPCFLGYGINLSDPSQTTGKDSFMKDGWFNTGDLGYLDEDGYLFITGRSKEVINRGGEIISPMEVEEAVLSHPDVAACAAFSAFHNVLQEVVGIAIVPAPNRPRVDLQALHDYLGDDRLAAPKWPQCVVFMDALPKSHTNKLLRVKLGERLDLPEFTDGMHPIDRTFQAICPPQGAPLELKISCEKVKVSSEEVQTFLRGQLWDSMSPDRQIWVIPHPTRVGSLVCHLYQVEPLEAIRVAKDHLHCYLVPTHFCILEHKAADENDLFPPRPSDALISILRGPSSGVVDPLVAEVQGIFQALLDLDYIPPTDSSFFNLGGSSLLGSQLASRVRKVHDISFSGAEVFQHSSCAAIAKLIEERRDGGMAGSKSMSVSAKGAPFPSERLPTEDGLFPDLIQLIPLCIVYPVFQISRFFLFFNVLLWNLHKIPSETGSIITFGITLVIFHLLWVTFMPLVFVIIKWAVIGRYKEGRYALWSNYYLRWWFVDVCRKLFGRGIWGSSKPVLNFYYRMLGAKIGKGAKISLEATLAEFDLVTIGEAAAVEHSTVRAFGLDNGAMILGPIYVGSYASVGCRSVVAPYTMIPDDCHLGPVSSSYEGGAALDIKNVRFNRAALPSPSLFSQVFIASPITFLVDLISKFPAFLVLFYMMQIPGRQSNINFHTMSDLMEWLCDPRRIPYYIGIRLAKNLITPFVKMAGALVVKWLIIGKFQAGPRDTTSEWQLLRHTLAATLFSRQNIQEVTELLGRHYELVSCLYRLCGAKVGRRVFWPGVQPVFSGEFELLEIGDDVVFGSRSTLLCISADYCEKITLCAGSNVADNCVLLPGSIIGKNAVLGSNSVCPEGRYLPESSLWFGAQGCEPVMLEPGTDGVSGVVLSNDIKRDSLQFEGDRTTLRPFGKAFYNGDATYRVIPLYMVIAFTFLVRIFFAAFHTTPLLGALHGAGGFLWGLRFADRDYASTHYSSFTVFTTLVTIALFTNFVRVVLWLAIEVGAKWTIMGQRKEGRYNWDTSPYAQNWELYQGITRIRQVGRHSLMDFICGTRYMVDFFRWHGCKIGKSVCLYPTGGDPYMPEPDLVDIGDRCAIDCASIVTHLNTKGNFELVKIKVSKNCTLRARSRIQQGVYMEPGSMLLEKGLVMTGEIIEADSAWQGAPASRLFAYSNDPLLPSALSLSDLDAGYLV
jgi:acyl-coenzyme A synthetase/AMP-(fatty) acid ligase